MGMIKLRGQTVESAEFEVDEEEYAQAKEDGLVDHLLDAQLSDMDGETVVIEPDGSVFNPYSNRYVYSPPGPETRELQLQALGKLTYERYVEALDGVLQTARGGIVGLPEWDSLESDEQSAWVAGAISAAKNGMPR